MEEENSLSQILTGQQGDTTCQLGTLQIRPSQEDKVFRRLQVTDLLLEGNLKIEWRNKRVLILREMSLHF